MASLIQLMGAHEIRARLGGMSRQRVYQLTSRADFPKPVADLRQGKVWSSGDVEAWVVNRRPHQADLDEAENPRAVP
jgi:predicted DNA-binding transcriptional regulator AlpA